MKKILFIFTFIATFCFEIQAQNKTVNVDGVYSIYGTATDTVGKYRTTTYSVYVTPFAEVIKYRPTITRVTGTYTKVRVIMQSSIDYSNWIAKDTVTLSGTGTTLTGLSKTSIVKDPYVRFVTAPYDSVQVLKQKNVILIDK